MKKTIVILNFIIISSLCYCQTITTDTILYKTSDTSETFSSICEQADVFYSAWKEQNGGVMVKNEKLFRRWQYYWSSRCSYPNAPLGGSVQGADNYLRFVNNNFNTCQQGPSAWSSDGPATHVLQEMGIVVSVAVDPTNSNIIYAGSNSAGLWKSINGGTTWENKMQSFHLPGLGVSSIAINPQNNMEILIGTTTRSFGYFGMIPEGIGILRSTDGGNTWSTTNIPFPGVFSNIEVVKYHPTTQNLVYAAGSKKIYKSTNGGLTWNVIYTNPTSANAYFIDMEFNKSNPTIMYASTDYSGFPITATSGAQFFSTVDGGVTWIEMS